MNKWLGNHPSAGNFSVETSRKRAKFLEYLEKRISVCLVCFKAADVQYFLAERLGGISECKSGSGERLVCCFSFKCGEKPLKDIVSRYFSQYIFKESLWVPCRE